MKHCTDTERNTPTGGELARELSGGSAGRGIGRLPFRQVINFEQTPATKEHMLLVIRPGLAAPPSPRHPMPPCPNKPMNPKRVHVAWGSICQSKAQPVDRSRLLP